MSPVLLVDLQDTGVLLIGGRENPRGLAWQQQRGVGAPAVNHAADHKHAGTVVLKHHFASGNLAFEVPVPQPGTLHNTQVQRSGDSLPRMVPPISVFNCLSPLSGWHPVGA